MTTRIARNTGAAVVSIGHVTKDPETRGRFAIGGQAKMAALTGAAYVVEVVEPLGRGLRGVVALRVGKDRPGHNRAHSGQYRAKDRTQEAARVVVDGTGPLTLVTVERHATQSTTRNRSGQPRSWRKSAGTWRRSVPRSRGVRLQTRCQAKTTPNGPRSRCWHLKDTCLYLVGRGTRTCTAS